METEDDPKARNKAIRLPEDFIEFFEEAAKANGKTWMDAAREALAEWAKKHHP